jgi:hypothetical protein
MQIFAKRESDAKREGSRKIAKTMPHNQLYAAAVSLLRAHDRAASGEVGMRLALAPNAAARDIARTSFNNRLLQQAVLASSGS